MGLKPNGAAKLGHTIVISGVTFAREFTSFWRTSTPAMEPFVRQLNRGLYRRDSKPMSAETAANRRAFVNEIAYRVFAKVIPKEPQEPTAELIASATSEVWETRPRIFRESDLSSGERLDVQRQVKRLIRRLCRPKLPEPFILNPEFPGCGIVDTCYGDVLAENTLYEIKAGDRGFLSIDIRQLLIYVALNRASGRYRVVSIGLVNPRMGVSFEANIDELSARISGQTSSDLLDLILYAVSSGEVSR